MFGRSDFKNLEFVWLTFFDGSFHLLLAGKLRNMAQSLNLGFHFHKCAKWIYLGYFSFNDVSFRMLAFHALRGVFDDLPINFRDMNKPLNLFLLLTLHRFFF